jgi:hypothetical protein
MTVHLRPSIRFLLREFRHSYGDVMMSRSDPHTAMHRAWRERDMAVLGTEDIGVIESAESFYDRPRGEYVFRIYGQPLPPMEPILP